MRFLLPMLLCALTLYGPVARAEILGLQGEASPVLAALADLLHPLGIDVAHNLNLRELASREPQRPRLGLLADIPPLTLPMSEELDLWEKAYADGEIGVLALLVEAGGNSSFHDNWLAAPPLTRILLSYEAQDEAVVQRMLPVLAGRMQLLHLAPGEHAEAEQGGRLYAVAGQRWVLDSTAARDYRSDIPEFLYLGESLRRNSVSVLNPDSRANRRLASSEPAVFLKESLGDEFEASTIPEIIVPGGIAFGEPAVFSQAGLSLLFTQEQLWLLGEDGARYVLPSAPLPVWKAAYDFAVRSSRITSDAIVDIDERGRVRISAALADTDLAYEMVHVDTQPFQYVRRLDVRKSVIIDNRVRFETSGQAANFSTDYEVRFLQADRMRIARTRAAIVYRYLSDGDSVAHIDSWGPDAFRLEGRTDFEGLGASTVAAARYAAWIALFRKVHENGLPFTYGRYEFLKLEKAGRTTPARM